MLVSARNVAGQDLARRDANFSVDGYATADLAAMGTNLGSMTYTTAQGRQQILDVLADAADEIAVALALLSEAYEHLDEYAAERLEGDLFRPIQAAYGRAKRVHAGFAGRHELSGRAFETPSPVAPSNGTKGLVEAAVDVVSRADGVLAELQDSLLPVEVGDVELRAGLTEVRELLGDVRSRARELVRTLGR
jgi:hypothetical protein